MSDGGKALDIGSGSGYLLACMGHMVGPRGRVIGIEHIRELVDISMKNLMDDCPDYLKDGRIEVIGTL